VTPNDEGVICGLLFKSVVAITGVWPRSYLGSETSSSRLR
jgi:hypothetical protein